MYVSIQGDSREQGVLQMPVQMKPGKSVFSLVLVPAKCPLNTHISHSHREQKRGYIVSFQHVYCIENQWPIQTRGGEASLKTIFGGASVWSKKGGQGSLPWIHNSKVYLKDIKKFVRVLLKYSAIILVSPNENLCN